MREICVRLKCDFQPDEIKEMIAVADINGDGFIEFEEFVRIMLMHEWKYTDFTIKIFKANLNWLVVTQIMMSSSGELFSIDFFWTLDQSK